MQHRICPGCGREWWSADEGGVWICLECGAEILPEEGVIKCDTKNSLNRKKLLYHQ